jgi:hypothetical protein
MGYRAALSLKFSTHYHGFALPRHFEICHCLLAALGVTAIVWVLRKTGGNRLEPRLTGRCLWVKDDLPIDLLSLAKTS